MRCIDLRENHFVKVENLDAAMLGLVKRSCLILTVTLKTNNKVIRKGCIQIRYTKRLLCHHLQPKKKGRARWGQRPFQDSAVDKDLCDMHDLKHKYNFPRIWSRWTQITRKVDKTRSKGVKWSFDLGSSSKEELMQWEQNDKISSLPNENEFSHSFQHLWTQESYHSSKSFLN